MMRKTIILLLSLAAYSGVYAIRPSEPEASIQRGCDLFERGRWSDARSQFVKVKQMLSPADHRLNETADYYLAVCAMQLDAPEAESTLLAFMDNYPASIYENDIHFALGLYYSTRNEFDKAMTEFDKVDYLLLNSACREKYDFRVGYIEFVNGSYDDAYDLLSRIGSQSEYYDNALYYRAYIEYSRGRYETSKGMFKELLASESYAELAPYYLLQIEYKQGNYPYVVKNGETLLAKSSSSQRVELLRVMSESCFRMENYRRAAELMEQYAASGGAMGREEHYIRGYSLYRSTRYSEAVEELTKVCGPDDALTQNASYHLAHCYIKLGNKSLAAEAFAMASGDGYDDNIAENALLNYAKLKYELDDDRFNESINLLNRYLARYPDSESASEVQTLLVTAYSNSKNYDAAYNAIKQIPNPDGDIRALLQKITYSKAVEAYQNGDIEQAETLLDESVSIGIVPKYKALGLFCLGDIAYAKGDYRSAIDLYSKYLDLAPKSEKEYKLALYNLGYAHFALNENDKSKRRFNDFLSNNKEQNRYYADALNRRGDIEYLRREYSSAADSYAKAARVDVVEQYYAQYQRAVVLGLLGRTGQKIDALKAIVKANRGDYVDDAEYELGRTYIVQERYSDGAATLEKFVEKYPSSSYHTQALLDLGLAYVNMGNNDKALANYKKVVEKGPQSVEARDAMRGIREIYIDSGAVDDYFEYASRAGVEYDSSNMYRDSLTFQSARSVYMSGKNAEAVSKFERYIAEYPKGYYFDDALFYLSDCHIKNGDKEKSLTTLGVLVQRPDGKYTVAALSNMGRIASDLEHYDTAATAYRRLYDAESTVSGKAGAMTGYIRAVKAYGDDDTLLAAADDVVSHEDSGETARREALFAKAMILKKRGDSNAALEIFSQLGQEVKSSEGAQSAYEVIASEYAAGHFDEAENLVYAFAEKNTPHAYWLGKSFLLLGDIYRSRNNLYQARATYQSIVDGYSIANDGLIDEARARISNLK